MAWMNQEQQQLGLKITEPPSTEPDRKPHHNTVFDLSWDGEDTQPGIGPVNLNKTTEMKMFPPYKPEPKPPEERSNKLFVFGLLRSGFCLNIVVARDHGFLGAIKTPPVYRMINFNDEVPCLIEGGNTAIVGELYEVQPRTIEWLDGIEECPMSQYRKIISLEDGTRAHCYFLNRWKIPTREDVILSGDWAEWKRGERARKAERKRLFLERMAKGKSEAEARRKAVLDGSLNGSYDSNWRDKVRVPVDVEHDPNRHSSRLYDPITRGWKQVPAGAVNDIVREPTTYTDSRTGKKTVHISDVPMEALRLKLLSDGKDADGMTDAGVRMQCMTKYGMWYEVEE